MTVNSFERDAGRTSVLLRRILDLLFAGLSSRRVTGLDNIPSDGGCLLVFNHLSNFDPPLIFTLLRRSDVTGLVAANYRRRANGDAD